MILLDTNVISELMKSKPTDKVLEWITQQVPEQLFISSITIAEITYGISVLPNSKQRQSLEKAFTKTINEAFKYRLLSFNEAAAYIYGDLMAHRKKQGKPMSILDGQIAAIATENEAALATRNTRDFTH